DRTPLAALRAAPHPLRRLVAADFTLVRRARSPRRSARSARHAGTVPDRSDSRRHPRPPGDPLAAGATRPRPRATRVSIGLPSWGASPIRGALLWLRLSTGEPCWACSFSRAPLLML